MFDWFRQAVPKILSPKWVPAQRVSEGGDFHNPRRLTFKGLHYISTRKDPMFLSRLAKVPLGPKLVIPDGITGIGTYAFREHSSIMEIVLPDSVTQLSSNVFADCRMLTCVNLPAGLKKVEYGLFQNCTHLKEIDLPAALSEIGPRAFGSCSRLEAIDIPDSVTAVGSEAFSGCSSLRTVRLPEGLTQLGAGAFADCTALDTVILPASLAVVPSLCFSGCTGLKSIVLKGCDVNRFLDESALLRCSCNIFLEVPSADSIRLAEAYSEIESESGMWGYVYHKAWNEQFTGKLYFSGQWHYDTDGNPVPDSP